MSQSQKPEQKAPVVNDTSAIGDVIETVYRLRAPDGCPWDRKQTHLSLRPYLIEESYEAIDTIDRIQKTEDLKNAAIRDPFKEELGDVLMQVLLHSELAREAGAFDFSDVARVLNEKLVRRHPHVFGEIKADNAESAVNTWEKQKLEEKKKKPTIEGALSGVPKGLPALLRAVRVIEKCTRIGFQWPDLNGPIEKLDEELHELKEEILSATQNGTDLKNLSDTQRQRIEGELGDLLFSVCNVAHMLRIQPEDALRGTLHKFESRFKHVERRLRAQGKTPNESTLEEMDHYWNEAKAIAKAPYRVIGLTGGVASGKSTLAKALAAQGLPVVDADALARTLSAPDGRAHPLIATAFGTEAANNRTLLRKMVFESPEKRKLLEAILHPLIAEEARLRFEDHAKSGKNTVVYEASLLVETGLHEKMSELIVVEAPEEKRIERLTQRDKVSALDAKKIIEAQANDETRRQAASILIYNSGTTEELEAQAQEIALKLQTSKPLSS